MAVRTREGRAALFFIGPNFLGFLVFVAGPIVASFLMAFLHYDPTRAAQWAGLANFRELLGVSLADGHLKANDPDFWYYFANTLFLMLGIPIGMVGSFLLAVLLSSRTRGLVFYRTIYFLPHIAAAVAVCVVWIMVLQPERGLLNQCLTPALRGVEGIVHVLGRLLEMLGGGLADAGHRLAAFSFAAPRWLGDKHLAKPALILMGIWQGVGGVNMILYLAALQNIPDDLYESASIDGAGAWSKMIHITWPMVSPTTFFIFVISCINGFQAGFNQAYLMTQGGPDGATTTLVYYIFNNAYVDFRMGYAAAISWILFALVFALTALNWRFGGRVVHYE